MPSSLDYLGRSWGLKTQKVWGVRCSAVADREMHNKCGRGANRGQKLLARCGQRTKMFCPRDLYSLLQHQVRNKMLTYNESIIM